MDSKPTILVVDDEFSIRESFNLILSSKYRVIQAATGEGALSQAAAYLIDLVYLDIRMPGLDGIETLARIKEISPETEVVMVTAVNDVQKAAQAIKIGAYDYIVKPFDVDKILNLTEDILRRKGLLSVMRGIGGAEVPALISANDKMLQISQTIEDISKTSQWSLVIGESGVEKEWIAKLIHQQSNPERPFVSLNLKGMSEASIERKIFGKKEGITTSDLRKESGIASEAGTLFLDNIESLSNDMQIKLSALHIRVVCASNFLPEDLNLKKELLEKFGGSVIFVPPLRERTSDIPLLLEYFFSRSKASHSSSVKEILPAAKDILYSYSWPGNTAELKAIIERLVLIADKPVIEIKDLPLNILISSTVSMPLEENYSEFEKEFISSLLEENSNNLEKTSGMLRISPQVLKAKI